MLSLRVRTTALRTSLGLALAIATFGLIQPALFVARAADAGPQTEPVKSLDAALASGRITKDTLSALGSAGTARVVVRLTLPTAFRPEGTIPSQADVQRRQITAVQDAILKKLAGQRVSNVKRFRSIPHMALEVDRASLTALVAMPEVAIVHPDRVMTLNLGTSVPQVGATPVHTVVGVPQAGAGQAVAILDTGVGKLHPFITGRTVSEACYSTDSGSLDTVCNGQVEESTLLNSGVACAFNRCDHGTHVAGIAAGNGTGIAGAPAAGVAPGASLINIQVFSRENNNQACQAAYGINAPCPTAQSSDVVRGLERVYDLRNTFSIAAVNLSLGGGFYTSQATCDNDNSDFNDIIDNLRSRGIPTVVASGNGANTPTGFMAGIGAPACVSGAISVGRTQGNTPATESVFPSSQTANFLTLLAPGSNINSSILPAPQFGLKSGTSMAAPHVTGALAVLRALRPNQTLDTYLNALTSSGFPLTDLRGGLNIVTPRLQLDGAAEALLGRPLPPTNVRIGTVTGRTIQLLWDDNARGETRFKLERRRASDAGFQEGGSAPQNAQAGAVTGLTPDAEYRLRIRACDAANNCSDPSPELTQRTLDTIPSAPTLQSGTVTPNVIQLVWGPTEASHVSYSLRSESGWANNLFTTTTPPGNSTGTAVTVFVPGATYDFYLKSCGVDGYCSPETHLAVTTPLPPGAPYGLQVDSRTTTTLAGVATDNFALSWVVNAADMVAWDIEWYRTSIWTPIPNPPTYRTRITNAQLCTTQLCLLNPPPPAVGSRVSYTLPITPAGSSGGLINFKVRGVSSTGAVTTYSPEVWYTYP